MDLNTIDKQVRSSIELFFLIPLVAVAMAVISSAITYQVGLPETLPRLMQTTVAVSLCVSIPMGALAAQYDLRIRRSHEKLEELASTDPLTGLLNRRSFRSAVSDELARMRRTGNPAAITFVDLDHFKALNDTYGHHFGDTVLCEVAVLLSDELRHPFDKICRWGGEEFVILTSNVTREQAELVLERLRARLQNHRFEAGRNRVRVTASFGAAPIDCANGMEAALRLADEALYEAKSGGRNKVVFSTLAFDHGQLAVAS